MRGYNRLEAGPLDLADRATIVWLYYGHEMPTHRIAALFDLNQGRVSEIVSAFRRAFAPAEAEQ